MEQEQKSANQIRGIVDEIFFLHESAGDKIRYHEWTSSNEIVFDSGSDLIPYVLDALNCNRRSFFSGIPEGYLRSLSLILEDSGYSKTAEAQALVNYLQGRIDMFNELRCLSSNSIYEISQEADKIRKLFKLYSSYPDRSPLS